MNLKESRKRLISIVEEQAGDDTEVALKLLAVVIAEFMLRAETNDFDVTIEGVVINVSVGWSRGRYHA